MPSAGVECSHVRNWTVSLVLPDCEVTSCNLLHSKVGVERIVVHRTPRMDDNTQSKKRPTKKPYYLLGVENAIHFAD